MSGINVQENIAILTSGIGDTLVGAIPYVLGVFAALFALWWAIAFLGMIVFKMKK